MMVTPGVDGCGKALNHWKILQKTRNKNKRILKPKYKLSGSPVFAFNCFPGGRLTSLPSVSYTIEEM